MHNDTKFWSTLIRLLAYGIPYYKLLILAALMLCIAASAEVAGPALISYFIDNFLSDRTLFFFPLIILIITFISLQVLSVVLRYYQALFFNNIALIIVQKLRTEIMDATLRQELIMFDTQPVGQLISRITNDTEVVKDLYVTVVASIMRSITLIITMLVAMFFLSWKLACISLLLFPIVTIVMWLYQYYSTPIVRQLRIYIANINNAFNEVINGMEIIQQFSQQQRFRERLYKINYAHLKARMKTLRLEGYLLRPMLSLLFTTVLGGMLILFGLSPNGTLSVGVLYAFINYLGRLNEPLIELTSQQSIMQQAIVGGGRIFEIIDNPGQKYGSDDRPFCNGSIELRDLSFIYRYKTPVLKNISLMVPSKSFLALVGHTGSGKSTLASLIMGYYPVKKNSLLLDNRPIETLTHRLLRTSIAMVQQDPVVMADTVYINVTMGRNISEDEVWNVLRKVKLDSLVKSLPNGIHTELGEQGNILSVGQKQLLSLARVLVSNPSILILDEATANIDSGNEQVISKALKDIRCNTTLVVIAHRLSTIIEADKILVLDHGKAVEYGTHEQLLQKKGLYYKMYKFQKVGKNFIT